MDFLIQVGDRRYKREYLTDRASTAGQSILAHARMEKTPIYCRCTDKPLPLFVRKEASGYTLVRSPGHGSDHHEDCPSGKEYRQSEGGHGHGASKLGAIVHRLKTSLLDSSDLEYLLRLLWKESGYCEWHQGFIGKRKFPAFNRRLKDAAQKIRLGDFSLADILVILGEDRALLGVIKARYEEFGIMPILIGRFKEIGQPVHSYPVHFFGDRTCVWTRDIATLHQTSDYALSLMDAVDVRVYGLFQVKVTERDNVNSSFGSLMAADGNEWIPVVNDQHRVLIETLIQERRHFQLTLDTDGQFNIELLDTPNAGQRLYIAPMDSKPATIGAWYWDSRKQPLPPALPSIS
jgi:hypothetical protein